MQERRPKPWQTIENSIYINARGMDGVGVKFADFNQFFDFCYANFSAGCDHRIKVACRLAINKVAGLVSFPRLDNGDVGLDAFLEHIFLVAEFPDILSFR